MEEGLRNYEMEKKSQIRLHCLDHEPKKKKKKKKKMRKRMPALKQNEQIHGTHAQKRCQDFAAGDCGYT
jgi:hypothetical protein